VVQKKTRIKYEKIYLNPPEDGLQLYRLVDEYFEYYNLKRGIIASRYFCQVLIAIGNYSKLMKILKYKIIVYDNRTV